MTDRAAQLTGFLHQNGWADASRAPIAGDASGRKYERLTLATRHAIVMDAPPDAGENIAPFIAVATYLHDQGLNAPDIFAQDQERGFLLLEDFGDQVFAKLMASDPSREVQLYLAATDVLLGLAQAPLMTGLAIFTPKHAAEICDVAFDWYGNGVHDSDKAAAIHALKTALETHASDASVTALRDYHVENLIWCPAETGIRRVGLLDFQDAVIAHPAYDLVSLLTDVRRDVPRSTRDAVIDHYLAHTSGTYADFTATFAALAAQRALRILGVFARLSLKMGKPQYVAMIPRVWGVLQDALAHPELAELARVVNASLPEPDPKTLARLTR